jgi:NAD-reducing hydrogenase large subunit
MPVLVQRLCGICPVSHHLAAAKAADVIVGADKLTPTAEKVRRLMHYGQMFQSHALHFFHLASPDLLFGFDADPKIRNVIGIIFKDPELATKAVLMRKYGQEIIKITAGKKIHGTGAIPGGVNKNVSVAERDFLLKDLETMIEWSRLAMKIVKDITVAKKDFLVPFGSFDSNHLSLVRADGAMDLYHGNLRAVDAKGKKIFDQVDYQGYEQYIAEEVRNWSYMKFPFIRSLGPEKGWYRVGPLARVNAADFIDTPEAEQERKEFETVFGKTSNITMAYHWARIIELVHSIEKIKGLLHDKDLQGNDLVVAGKRRDEGVGLIEAPRGTLFHHYRVNKDDQVVMANLIVSTTHNNEPMNRAVHGVAMAHLDGKKELTEGLLNHLEVAIRAYDPCLSCATHALGQMPLVVEMVDESGAVIARKTRG